MKLYHSPASPFVRKIMVVMQETGQFDDVEIIAASGTAIDTGTMPIAQNPLGKIPALERADGPALYDSRVIMRYLDDRAGGRLYPEAPRLWETLTLEATAEGIIEAALAMVYEVRLRPQDMQFSGFVDAQWLKAARALDAIEARWMSHLNGRLDAAHIGLGCALGYIDFRLADRNWRENRPLLAAWYAEFSKRDSMQATEPA